MIYSDFVHNVLPWFGVAGFLIGLYNLFAKPKLLVQRSAWRSTNPLAGSAQEGTWYEADLFIHNDGLRDCFGAIRVTMCLQPGWGIASSPNLAHCEAMPEDSDPKLRGWARFEISTNEPVQRKRSRQLRYFKIALAAKANQPPPETIFWRIVYEGGARPREGYEKLASVDREAQA